MSIKEVKEQLRKLYEEIASPFTKDYIKEYNVKQLIPECLVELHKKISIPFANLAFGLIGVPLGLMVRRGGRMVGLGVGVALIIFYYIILTVGEKLAKTGSIHPFLGAWAPNIITSLIGVFLIIRTVREVPLRSLKLIRVLFPSESK
jgi:lipopolysaccharide export LptBFGC system permease protein LptF